MASRERNYRKLLSILCAFSGVFARGGDSFAVGSKSGKKGIKTSNTKNTGNKDAVSGEIGRVINLIKKHPVPSGAISGTLITGLAVGSYYVGKAVGWWGKNSNDGKKDDTSSIVFGSTLAYHENLDFNAWSFVNSNWGDRYCYGRSATNGIMRKAILKELLFKNDNSDEGEKKLNDYLTTNKLKDYIIFGLEPCQKNKPSNGKYVIIFDASLFNKMTEEQRDAIKGNVYENGGFAVLGVEVQRSINNKAPNYSCSIKNLGELGYSFQFGTQDKRYIFNKQSDNSAVKNVSSEDSLSYNPVVFEGVISDSSLPVYCSGKQCGIVDRKVAWKFLGSFDGFSTKVNDKTKSNVYNSLVLYDVGYTRLLVFNILGKNVFCDLFKDKFVALGGYGFVVFEKDNQNNKWSAANIGEKYKITSRKGANFAFDFEIAKPN